MFENRSFDNLLGRLYEPGEVASFEGVLGRELSNPIPEWAEDSAERDSVAYGVASSVNTPSLDPGEDLDRATGAEAIDATHGLFHGLFPGIHS